MGIIKHRKIFYIISGTFVAASLFFIFYFGLNLGIDFTGGSLIEVEYAGARPENSTVSEKLSGLNLSNISVQPTGEKGIIIRSKNLQEPEHQAVLDALRSLASKEEARLLSGLNEVRFDSIGPIIGKELANKSWMAITMVLAMIIFYIAFAFRKVSRPVSSFKYGLAAVIALAHDVIIPTGIFAVLGKYMGVEIDVLFVTALLTILGFSVHDTIVVFDRVRENLIKGVSKDFEETVGQSVSQTITRSINTSLTVILVLFALFFLGGETTKYFSLVLILGVSFGTYSSIFLASPMLVTAYKFQERKGKSKKKK